MPPGQTLQDTFEVLRSILLKRNFQINLAWIKKKFKISYLSYLASDRYFTKGISQKYMILFSFDNNFYLSTWKVKDFPSIYPSHLNVFPQGQALYGDFKHKKT